MEYTKEQLVGFKNEISKIENFMNESINWVERTPNVIDKAPLIKKIKKQRRQIRTLIPRVTEKPTVAFFGASQCGKSHLVKNLLKDENQIFEVFDCERNINIDFMLNMNPSGKGQEATGVVTRFAKYEVTNKPILPIRIELFSVKDIILVLIDGFATLGPVSKLLTPSENEISDVLEKIKNQYSEVASIPLITEDQMFEIKNYVEEYNSKELSLLLHKLEQVDFWELIISYSSKINIQNIKIVFSLFWYNQKNVTDVFELLLEGIDRCKYSEFCFADFDLVLRQVPDNYVQFSSFSNILDVQTLRNLGKDSDAKFKILTLQNEAIMIEPNLLSAITKEVTLYNNTKDLANPDFLNYVDILDFPGCRTGTEISATENINEENIIDIIKRGKINYLFNTYSDNFKINNLSIVSCLTEQKDTASLVPKFINYWINNNIGKNPEERDEYLSKSKNPFFIIFSWFNEIISFKEGYHSKDPTNDINNTINTRLSEDLFSNYAWMKNWGCGDNNIFRNFYLLRDFKYCKLYEKNENSEIRIKSIFDDYFIKVKNAFVNNINYQNYFENPLFNFDEASLPNKDGSQLIIKQLQEVRSNRFKTESILSKVKKSFKTVNIELASIRKSDDENDRIDEIKSQTHDVTNRILALVNDDENVGVLTDQFSAAENEIYHVVYAIVKNKDFGNVHSLRKFFSFYLQYPELKGLSSYSEKIKYLAQKFGKDQKETEFYLNDLGYDVELLLNQNVDAMEDKALYIANKAKSFWIENQLNIENFKSDKRALSPGFIQLIMNNLKDKYEILKLSDKIADHIRPFVENPGGHIDDVIPMISSIITGIINNHVSSFGWEYVEDTERNRLLSLCKEHDIEILDSLVQQKNNKNEEHDIPKLYHYLENYKDIVNNLQKNDVEKIKMNPYICGYRKWIDMCNLSLMSTVESKNYDVKSNQELIKILDESNNISLS